jgi:hypothetical protein
VKNKFFTKRINSLCKYCALQSMKISDFHAQSLQVEKGMVIYYDVSVFCKW